MLPKRIVNRVSDGYDKLWKMFIQPDKLEYQLEALGPRVPNF